MTKLGKQKIEKSNKSLVTVVDTVKDQKQDSTISYKGYVHVAGKAWLFFQPALRIPFSVTKNKNLGVTKNEYWLEAIATNKSTEAVNIGEFSTNANLSFSVSLISSNLKSVDIIREHSGSVQRLEIKQ